MIIQNPLLTGSLNYNGADLSNVTSSNANSASVSLILTAVSSSQQQISSSYIALSGSYNIFSGSASTRVTQIENVYATTGSNSFRADQSITGSLVVSSTITAQTLVVQTVTSSIVYSSGSNNFGNQLANTQTFTGSVNITGSTNITGNINLVSSTGFPTVGLLNRSSDTTLYMISPSNGFTLTDSSLNTIYNATPTSHNWNIGNALKMKLDVSGSLGLGVTPSGWISTAKAFQLGNTAALYAPSSEAILSNNVFVDSTDNNKYITANFASQYRQVNGQHIFYSAASGSAGNTISFGSPKLTILSDGAATFSNNVSATTGTTGATIKLGGFTNYGTIQDVNDVRRIWFENVGSYRTIFDLPTSGTSFAFRTNDGTSILSLTSAGAATFASSVTAGGVISSEDVRIYRSAGTTTGYINFGSTGTNYFGWNGSNFVFNGYINATYAALESNVVGDPVYLRVRNTNTGGYPSSLALSLYGYSAPAAYFDALRIQASYPGYGSANFFVKYQSNSADVLALTLRGDGYMFSVPTYNNQWAGYSANMYIASDGSFGRITASSRRFKESIIDWSGNGLDTILALKPKTFKYKKDYCNSPDNIDFLGLIAEEVAEVSPYLAQYENLDRTGLVENVRYDTIVVPLIKAIQELKATNDNLQAQINELKAI